MKKSKKKLSPWLLGILAVLLIGAVLLVGCSDGDQPEKTESTGSEQSADEQGNAEQSNSEESDAEQSQTSEENESQEEAIESLALPFSLQDGKLLVTSVFQYDGLNPDCSNMEGSQVAAIAVQNVSDTYLLEAEIKLVSTDGEEYGFVLTDLPAGKEVMVFSAENAAVEADTAYADVECEAVFDEEASMNEEAISVSVDGIHVTLQNNTNEDISNVDVYCRSTLGDQYFGGITYKYNVTNLPAYGTAEIEAVDCILGLAEVVRIAMD